MEGGKAGAGRKYRKAEVCNKRNRCCYCSRSLENKSQGKARSSPCVQGKEGQLLIPNLEIQLFEFSTRIFSAVLQTLGSFLASAIFCIAFLMLPDKNDELFLGASQNFYSNTAHLDANAHYCQLTSLRLELQGGRRDDTPDVAI